MAIFHELRITSIYHFYVFVDRLQDSHFLMDSAIIIICFVILLLSRNKIVPRVVMVHQYERKIFVTIGSC